MCVCDQHWLSHLPIRFLFQYIPSTGLLISSQQFDRLIFIIRFNDQARAIHQCMPCIRVFRFICFVLCVCVWGGGGHVCILYKSKCVAMSCNYIHIHTSTYRHCHPSIFQPAQISTHDRMACTGVWTLVNFIWPAASVSGWVYIVSGCVGVDGGVLENHYPINGFKLCMIVDYRDCDLDHTY